MTAEFQKQLDRKVCELVAKHHIEMEELTEQQMADAIKQAILAGDFQKVVVIGRNTQQVLYLPYHGVDTLRSDNERLKQLLSANGISHLPDYERDGIRE